MRVDLAALHLCISTRLVTAWVATPWRPTRGAVGPRALRVHTIGQVATLLTRNITDGETWLPRMGKDIQSMNELMTSSENKDSKAIELHQGGGEESSSSCSLRRAIEHTNAILDLYNETGSALSADLITSTLENVVEHAMDEPAQLTAERLEQVEAMVWRLRDFNLVPSKRVLNSLWDMQKCHCNDNHDAKASKQVGRQVNLLTHWREWSALEGSTNKDLRGRHSRLPPPPLSYFLDVLQYAATEQVTMSFTLWELYQSMSRDPKVACEQTMYQWVLQILAQSPSPAWNVRQRRVINDMITQSRLQQQLDQTLWPDAQEIRQALRATVPVGRAQDAAWLLRILEMSPNQDKGDDCTRECRTLFLKAVLHSDDPGSLMYMEELLMSGKWENDSLEHWKLLLRKIAQSKQAGCGARARVVLDRIEQRHQQDSVTWRIDAETAFYVVQSYINEPQRKLSDILEVAQLVKRYASTHDLYTHQSQTPVRLFDTLLASFDEYVCTDPRAVNAADDLFRYFMVLYRDGRCGEEPDRFHLGHILRHYNRQFKKHLLQIGAEKSLEYFRLFRTLYHKKVISSPPDIFNVRQLLGTLARSGEPGFGSVANETLTEALAMESPVQPYASGHMYWCVIKCFCSENKIDKALAVLDDWEQAFAANPTMIRLTGAPYQTMINALAVGENDAAMTLQIVDRLERQHQGNNRHVVLRSKLYKEALQSCSHDADALEHVHQAFHRMNFTL